MANTGINRFAKADVNLNISRSRLDRSFGHTTSFKSGDLVPIFLDDVLPGDTIRIDYSMVTRMLTPVAPVFGNAFLDIWFFFIPNRLIADYGSYKKVWEQLQGENTSGYWANTSEMVLESAYFLGNSPMSVANYLGLPIKDSVLQQFSYASINTLPFKAYTLCWNEFFRDQNIEAPKDINTYGVSNVALTNRYITNSIGGLKTNYGYAGSCLKVAKLHDYFTSCLPAPQKGDPVKIGLTGDVPVYSIDSSGQDVAVKILDTNGDPVVSGQLGIDNDSNLTDGSNDLMFGNLYADLSAATATTINNLRQAFAIQRLLETDARGGKNIA